MTQYNVHIFVVVRVKVPSVEAENQKEAMSKAEERVGLRAFDNVQIPGATEVEYADEILSYLVEGVGDEAYEHSRRYDAWGRELTQ